MKKKSSLRSEVLQRVIQEWIMNAKNLDQIRQVQITERAPEIIQEAKIEKATLIQAEKEELEVNPDKLDGLISMLEEDPQIEKMECPGPDKPIVLVKNGIIVQTPLTLSKEEIESAITKVAQETGNEDQETISVLLGEWIFNGILSEFGGSRFTIERQA